MRSLQRTRTQIARVGGIPLETARAMVKQMVEEGLAHVPYGEDEPCLLQDAIEEVLEQGAQMMVATLVVNAQSLPPNYEDIAHGVALKHDVTVAEARGLAKGVILKVQTLRSDEGWFKSVIGEFARDLESELEAAREPAAADNTLTINVQGNFVAGAVGQNASVSNSNLSQHVSAEVDEDLAELALLLGQLLDEATQQGVRDYSTLGRMQEARDAAERGEVGAVRRLLESPVAKKVAALAANASTTAIVDKLPVLLEKLLP